MASADFSPALTEELSPGKALILFLRAVRLYLARLRMDFGLRGGQHAYRPYAASLPVCVPTVEGICSPLPSAFPVRLAPHDFRSAVPYGYLHRSRQDRFILLESAHAGHTGARLGRAALGLQAHRPPQKTRNPVKSGQKLSSRNEKLYRNYFPAQKAWRRFSGTVPRAGNFSTLRPKVTSP